MTQCVCSIRGRENVWSGKKNICYSARHHVCRLHLGSGTMRIHTWWHLEEVVTSRGDPLECYGMLPKILPRSLVLCVLAAKEVPGTFIMLPNIKETIYLEMENLHQRTSY